MAVKHYRKLLLDLFKLSPNNRDKIGEKNCQSCKETKTPKQYSTAKWYHQFCYKQISEPRNQRSSFFVGKDTYLKGKLDIKQTTSRRLSNCLLQIQREQDINLQKACNLSQILGASCKAKTRNEDQHQQPPTLHGQMLLASTKERLNDIRDSF